MFPSNAGDQLAVADFALVEGRAGVHGGAMTARQVIQHHDALAFAAQHLDHHAADVSGPAGYQNGHCFSCNLKHPKLAAPGEEPLKT